MRFDNLLKMALAVIFTMTLVGAWAQTVTISNEIAMTSDHNYDLIGYFNNKITLLEDDGRNITLHEFDDNLRKLNTPSIVSSNKKSRLFGYVPQDSMLTLYYKFYEAGKYIVSAVNYDSQLHQRSSIVLRKYDKNQSRVLPVIVSDDRTTHLISIEEAPSHITRYMMYNTGRNALLWESNDAGIEANLYDEDRRGRLVTDDGTYFALYINGHNKYKNNYTLLKVDASGYRRIELPFAAVPLTDIHMVYDNDRHGISITGIYLDDNLTVQEGLLMVKLDDNLNYVGEIRKIPFTRQTITDYFGQNQRQRNGIVDLELNEVQERRDGGHLLICEQRKEISRINNTGRSAFVPVSTSTDYYLEDIVLTSLDKDGNLEWQKVLQKKQYSYDDDAAYSSYFIHANPSHLRLLYNDEIKNENTISEYVVNPLGNVERRVMFNTAGSNLHLQVRNSIQVSANSSILPSIRKGKLRLLKVTY